MHITFTTLAVNQTLYFIDLCKELEQLGYSTSIISFHEESNELIKQNNIRVFNVFTQEVPSSYDTQIEFKKILEEYKIDCPNILLSHEKFTFNIRNADFLKKKFVRYFRSLEKIFNTLNSEYKNDLILFQELGGFASIVSAFYVARKLNIDNIFLEPSFFKGRMFFVKNTFLAFKVKETATQIDSEVRNYLLQAKEKKTIVIPKKDASHYRHPIRKIINAHNIKRLFQKTIGKYLSGKEEEFSYIWSFTYRHIRMLVNRVLLTRYYSSIPQEKFVYYPFHVPMDVALTVRAPLFVDQYSLIDYVSRNIPDGYKLAIKEHPAMIGVVSYKRVVDLLKRNDNIALLNPDINNHEVMSKMDLLVTVNSKTGAESLMLGKKVLCLGDAFYNESKSIFYRDNIKDLYLSINEILKGAAPSDSAIEQFFQSTYNQTFVGELYFCEKKNIADCANSIKNFLEQKND